MTSSTHGAGDPFLIFPARDDGIYIRLQLGELHFPGDESQGGMVRTRGKRRSLAQHPIRSDAIVVLIGQGVVWYSAILGLYFLQTVKSSTC